MNTDIHSYETRNRDNLHYFPYNMEGASKRIRQSMPNLINLLPVDVRLKINSLYLKQFVSFYKSITIASYDANCTIPGCYYVVTTEAFVTISMHDARTPRWVADSTVPTLPPHEKLGFGFGLPGTCLFLDANIAGCRMPSVIDLRTAQVYCFAIFLTC